jgi:hypothetical protein
MRGVRDDLSALIFELQRARSPVDKARAVARAWRTVRSLNPTERRLLAREIGFDGAEDLIEGLAGKGGGVFAPAAVLEALGKMRRDKDLSVRSILADLRDPDRREDLLVRGIDLVADSVDGDPDESPYEDFFEDELEAESEDTMAPPEAPVETSPPDDSDEDPENDENREIELPPVPVDEEPEQEPEPDPEPEPEPEPEVPSIWDGIGREREIEAVTAPSLPYVPAREADTTDRPLSEDSILIRLRAFRKAIPSLRGASLGVIEDHLFSLPEPWARRRALVALIEADIPADADDALDLIEKLDRPMDRRWCLSALARRGDLEGDSLGRALSMLTSPAARRRVEGLATRA